MKPLFMLVCSVFLFANLTAQKQCDFKELTIQDKKELIFFWSSLRKNVNQKDKKELANLCSFPFTCSICKGTSSDKPYIEVNNFSFFKEHHKIFFEEYFIDVVNKSEILQLLNIDVSEKDGSCMYNFSFPIVKPSKKGEGVQGFFTIKKVKEKFKIVSVWSIP